jgi:hypothetical protein
MGVDFFNCSVCGEIHNDCEYFSVCTVCDGYVCDSCEGKCCTLETIDKLIDYHQGEISELMERREEL